ncbi:MAG: T9SS type A sorting domain-containing protein [Salibacteraceae bacterium]
MKKYVLLIIMFTFGLKFLYAQEFLGSNGQSDTLGSIQLDWNVGEAVIGTSKLSNTIFTQGIEQPHFIISSIEKNNNGFTTTVSLFPNPTADEINLQLNEVPNELLIVTLFNAQGKIIFTEEVKESFKTFNLKDLPAASYQMIINTKSKSYYENFNIVKSY